MKIIIIGGEAAGMSVASKAKRSNPQAEITVYESSNTLSFGACGLPYFIANEFDDPSYMVELSVEYFISKGINILINHTVLHINANDKTVTVSDGAHTFVEKYDRLVIATGATANKPAIVGADKPNVFVLKTLDDGINIKKLVTEERIQNVTIIGAGFIGLELVETFIHLNKNVQLFETSDRVLSNTFDAEITTLLEDSLNQTPKLTLHLEEVVTALNGNDKITSLSTTKGKYETDLVIFCTGVRPNTHFLQNIGLDMLDNGAIRVNSFGESSLKDIYAVGDCATIWHAQLNKDFYSPLATGANKLGRIIGDNIVNNQKRFNGMLGSAAVRVLELEAGRTGLSENEAKECNIPYKKIIVHDKNHANYCKGQAQVSIKLIYHAETKVILGAQVFGANGGAVLRMYALSVAIMTQLKTEELAFLDFAYAPPFARVWDVLNIAGSVAK